MRKTLCIVALALGLGACGSSAKLHQEANSAQGKQATAAVDATVKRCLPLKDGAPDVFVLRSHAGRERFMNCAVPASKRVAFKACLTRVALGGIPSKPRLETGAKNCLAKVER